MLKSTKTTLIALAISLVVLASVVIALKAWTWFGINGLESITGGGSNPTTSEQPTTSPTTSTSPSPSASPAKTTPTPKPLSYSDAVGLYVNRRLQFDVNCVVNPSYVVFKKGTQIMLDNRYDKPRAVYLNGVLYNLSAYGFKIVTLTTTKPLPYTIIVDCGSGKNNGRIILE